MNPTTTNPDLLQNLGAQATGIWAWGTDIYSNLMRTWNFYQLVIVLVIFLIAWGLSRVAVPRMRAWLRSREGWPKWRYRVALVIEHRMRMIFFVVLTWITVWVMRQVTWPSRSYIVAIFANLGTAWLIVAFATRFISNPVMRSLVRYGAWTWVTLSILGLTGAAETALNQIAIPLGDVHLTLWVLLQAVVALVVLMTVAGMASRSGRRAIEGNENISPSMRVLAVKIMQVGLYGMAFFIGLKAVGVDLTGLAVLSGAIGIGVGFGLQKVVSNLVSGVIILLDKSIKPGDVISIGETFGWVESLGARYVSITTRDGREYLIPNEDLITGQVVNWSYSNKYVRLDINFGVSYADDPHEVRKLAVEAAAGCQRVLRNRPPVCHIVGFGDSSVDYILRFWITDPSGGLTNIRGNVFLALWDAFKEHGISIPFPQREVRLLGDPPSVRDPEPEAETEPVPGTGSPTGPEPEPKAAPGRRRRG